MNTVLSYSDVDFSESSVSSCVLTLNHAENMYSVNIVYMKYSAL